MKTKKQFQNAIDKAWESNKKTAALIKKAEQIFYDRYKCSSTNCDTWIDSMHIFDGNKITVDRIDIEMGDSEKIDELF